MSAAELRQAAETLRGLSESASRAPWVVDGEDDLAGTEVRAARGAGPSVATTIPLGYERRRANAAYIATMHPGVGLALADWLEAVAERQQPLEKWGRRSHGWTGAREANALARLINGGAA